jgi:hypothetical protein
MWEQQQQQQQQQPQRCRSPGRSCSWRRQLTAGENSLDTPAESCVLYAAQNIEHVMVTLHGRGTEQRLHGRTGMWQLLQRSQFLGSMKCGCGPLSSLQWAVSCSHHAAAAASHWRLGTAVKLQKQRFPLLLDLCCNACHPGGSMRSWFTEMCDKIE